MPLHMIFKGVSLQQLHLVIALKPELTTTCLLRPSFWNANFRFDNIKLPLNTCLKHPQIRGLEGDRCTQV